MIRALKYQFSTLNSYDIAVIGGGSGGLAFAFEALKLGHSVVVFDYVVPSPKGSKWGLGGTCVNVGCIPKKLMHQSALLKEQMESSRMYGWDPKSDDQVNWEELRSNVQDHIKGLNYGYKGNISKNGGTYINGMAAFKDEQTLIYGDHEQIKDAMQKNDMGQLKELKFKYCVVATGGRPTALESISQYAVTSDDIFSLEVAPKKTLVVGGGYIALETAGMLSGLGYDVTMMTRNLYLKDFDQGIAQRIMSRMQKQVRIIPKSLPIKSERQENGQIKVEWGGQEVGSDQFDTILMAIGRNANTKHLNLEGVGVKINASNGKILGGVNGEIERTTNKHIFAIGDVLHGVPELTPVASKSGQLLAHRISMLLKGNFKDEDYKQSQLDYDDYPTTVFTPEEYSCVGLSEEQAIRKIGQDNVEIYHSLFAPLEEQLCDRVDENYQLVQHKVYCKVICDKQHDLRVLGLHYLGPNAGEVMQGFAVAMKLGLKFKDLKRTVGIHPTSAEEFTQLKITQASNEDYEKHGC